MSALYYCTKENNSCLKREECKRYINSQNETCATLFKSACAEGNGYVLFLKDESKTKEEQK